MLCCVVVGELVGECEFDGVCVDDGEVVVWCGWGGSGCYFDL